MPLIRPILLSLVFPLLLGCGALKTISDAGASLDAFTLSPATTTAAAASGTRHLVVEMPTSAGALSTDRILVKPIPFQAQYLPDGRWSEPAPALVQTLLVASFHNLGGFRLVGRNGAGLQPDLTLMTELQEFHSEPSVPGEAPLTVRVSAMMTLIRESDRRIIGSRRFTASAIVTTDTTIALVSGFDSALQTVLQAAVKWTQGQAG
ncbi:MAG: ABC-type transport auxiliary lipoprotein family protein [Gemmobacter sp.]|nr:ABC-type transport auxiliary lipoprotein family protein [Gemmobacter sp.]